jgi:hypothetical protein
MFSGMLLVHVLCQHSRRAIALKRRKPAQQLGKLLFDPRNKAKCINFKMHPTSTNVETVFDSMVANGPRDMRIGLASVIAER